MPPRSEPIAAVLSLSEFETREKKKKEKGRDYTGILFPFDWLNKRSGRPPTPQRARDQPRRRPLSLLSPSRTGSGTGCENHHQQDFTFLPSRAIDRNTANNCGAVNSWRESPPRLDERLTRALIRSLHEYVDVLHDRPAMRVDRESRAMESNRHAAVAIKVG